jgi:hypothetical protein
MWVSRKTQLSHGSVIKFNIDNETVPMPYSEVLGRWQNDAEFRMFFTALLLDAPFPIYRWETPPVTRATVDRPFEFVLLDSPDLAGDPDPGAFSEHFAAAAPGEIVEFSNLGGDAILVVPGPHDPLSDYGQLAAFLRHSRVEQQHALWQALGGAMQRRLSSRPVWLSTAGGGVAWLHVRLDDYPKYYGYAAYRDVSG